MYGGGLKGGRGGTKKAALGFMIRELYGSDEGKRNGSDGDSGSGAGGGWRQIDGDRRLSLKAAITLLSRVGGGKAEENLGVEGGRGEKARDPELIIGTVER